MAKKTDLLVSMAGSFSTTAELLSVAMRERDSDLASSIVLLGQSSNAKKLAAVADVLASLKAPGEAEKALDPALKPWAEFYAKHFPEEFIAAGGARALFAIAVPIPPALSGYRLIVGLQGLTMNATYDACAKQFPCWRYVDNLDGNIPKNDRVPTASYAVWVRDRVEADEESANQSANDLAAKSHQGITLLERLLLELKYFDETGKHLDLESVTLCSGSRDADGHVPHADWYDGEFWVPWSGTTYRRPRLRSREVFK